MEGIEDEDQEFVLDPGAGRALACFFSYSLMKMVDITCILLPYIFFLYFILLLQYVRVSSNTPPRIIYQLMTQHWGLDVPNLLISVTGGAKNFNMKMRLKSIFRRGLVKVAQTTGKAVSWPNIVGKNPSHVSLLGTIKAGKMHQLAFPGHVFLFHRCLDHHWWVSCWCDEASWGGSTGLQLEQQLQRRQDCQHWHCNVGDRAQPQQPHLSHGEPKGSSGRATRRIEN